MYLSILKENQNLFGLVVHSCIIMGMFLYCDCKHISSDMYKYKQERKEKKCTKDGLVFQKKFLNNQSSVVAACNRNTARGKTFSLQH